MMVFTPIVKHMRESQSASMKMLKFHEWMVPERSGTRAQKLARKLMMGTSG